MTTSIAPIPPLDINDRLRAATRDLHGIAERSGFIADMLRGRVTRAGYALFLRNLLPAYRAMEAGLEQHRREDGLKVLALPALYRTPGLEADLSVLAGPNWEKSLTLLPAGAAYAEAVAISVTPGSRLIGHAYARYLGDLSGGRVLKRLLGGNPEIGPAALAFYEFPLIADLDAFRTAYREALDSAARALGDPDSVIDSALEAFRLNVALSEAVHRHAARAD
jgi:heme oxygenase